MRIAHAGYGGNDIPPNGWGAVESLIWDYKFHLEKLGHEFYIFNTRDWKELVRLANSMELDVIHVHNDQLFEIMSEFKAPVRILGSHDANIVGKNRRAAALRSNAYQRLIQDESFYICCLSEAIKESFLRIGIPNWRLFIARNGARSDLFRFAERAELKRRSICLGAVTKRKRQYLLDMFPFVDLVGPGKDSEFNYSTRQYLGEWSKTELYNNLTRYANLVLLSQSEAAPLVVREALMAGLGLVLSEGAVADLDRKRSFIDIIPEDRIRDSQYLAGVIRKNQQLSARMRKEIREYALREFDWQILVKQYARSLEDFLSGNKRHKIRHSILHSL